MLKRHRQGCVSKDRARLRAGQKRPRALPTSVLPWRTRWRGRPGLLAAPGTPESRCLFSLGQALAWFVFDWLHSAAVLVLSVLATLAFDRRSG
ncbi:hypothetical protein C3Y87_07065 [Carbonactinospora thermoautotrophica]|nr:hypothetical protein [Carbonactinospora thermoautotrophica]